MNFILYARTKHKRQKGIQGAIAVMLSKRKRGGPERPPQMVQIFSSTFCRSTPTAPKADYNSREEMSTFFIQQIRIQVHILDE